MGQRVGAVAPTWPNASKCHDVVTISILSIINPLLSNFPSFALGPQPDFGASRSGSKPSDSVLRNSHGVVPHIDPFYVEQHVFDDVDGVVSVSLQIPYD